MVARPRIRLAPQLSSITLDDILAGETCEPIGLADFEAYLMFKEHSVENLRFVVWYQSYRRRFFALPVEQQKLSPGPRGFNFALPTPARTAERISRTSTMLGSLADEPVSPTVSLNPPLTPTSISPMLSRIPSVHATAFSSFPTRTHTLAYPETQPFREECTLVASTFLAPSAPYELTLPSELLSTILRDLTFNTHPDVFLPAYEYAYDALLTHSLPHFLDGMRENMNWEKRAYWWLYGILSSCLGWAIAIGCLFIEYGPHMTEGRLRAWRLLSVPFLTLGAMQMYSAYRGFCSQIWGRGGMQLRPWELASPPPSSEQLERAQSASEKHPRPTSASSADSTGKADFEVVEVVEWHIGRRPSVVPEEDDGADGAHDVPCSPSTSHSPPPPLAKDGYRDVWDDAPPPPSPTPRTPHAPTPPLALARRASTVSFVQKPPPSPRGDAPYAVPTLSMRARVFGPERVVLDPRIRAVHRRVVRDLLLCGFVCGSVLTVVVVALPCWR